MEQTDQYPEGFRRLSELTQNRSQLAEKVHNKEAILVMGATGTGKSTALNYWAGWKITARLGKDVLGIPDHKHSEYLYEIDYDDTRHPPLVEFNIGHVNSLTLIPQIDELDQCSSVFCDLPGFSDSRGKYVAIANAVNIITLLQSAAAVKILLVINHSSLDDCRDRTFEYYYDLLVKMFGSESSLMEHASSVLLCVTKVPLLDMRGRQIGFEDLQNRVTFYNQFFSALKENVFFFDPEDEPHRLKYKGALSRVECLEKICCVKSVQPQPQTFHTFLSDAEERWLQKGCAALEKMIIEALIEGDFPQACQLYECTKSLEVVLCSFAQNLRAFITNSIAQHFQENVSQFETKSRECESNQDAVDTLEMEKETILKAVKYFDEEVATRVELKMMNAAVEGLKKRIAMMNARDRLDHLRDEVLSLCRDRKFEEAYEVCRKRENGVVAFFQEFNESYFTAEEQPETLMIHIEQCKDKNDEMLRQVLEKYIAEQLEKERVEAEEKLRDIQVNGKEVEDLCQLRKVQEAELKLACVETMLQENRKLFTKVNIEPRNSFDLQDLQKTVKVCRKFVELEREKAESNAIKTDFLDACTQKNVKVAQNRLEVLQLRCQMKPKSCEGINVRELEYMLSAMAAEQREAVMAKVRAKEIAEIDKLKDKFLESCQKKSVELAKTFLHELKERQKTMPKSCEGIDFKDLKKKLIALETKQLEEKLRIGVDVFNSLLSARGYHAAELKLKLIESDIQKYYKMSDEPPQVDLSELRKCLEDIKQESKVEAAKLKNAALQEKILKYQELCRSSKTKEEAKCMLQELEREKNAFKIDHSDSREKCVVKMSKLKKFMEMAISDEIDANLDRMVEKFRILCMNPTEGSVTMAREEWKRIRSACAHARKHKVNLMELADLLRKCEEDQRQSAAKLDKIKLQLVIQTFISSLPAMSLMNAERQLEGLHSLTEEFNKKYYSAGILPPDLQPAIDHLDETKRKRNQRSSGGCVLQ